jgi:hypothetical protein
MSSSDFFHHHKKRIKPENAPRRDRYVRRLGEYADKSDLVASGFANLPPGIDTPEKFCKLLVRNERRNGGLCEHEISITRVLSRGDWKEVGRALAMGMAGDSPVIWGVHCPPAAREGGDQPHVHALVYPKIPDGISRRDPAQIFKRANPKNPAQGGWKKDTGGGTLADAKEKLRTQRAKACEILNQCLRANGVDLQLDHRSYATRGINRDRTKHLGAYRAMNGAQRGV